jgi:putative oxidoreductase
MEIILKLNRWANAHTNYGIDALRVALGLFLAYKGIAFFNSEYLDNIAGSEGIYFLLTHYISMAHLAGGILIALGLITRLSALVQIPILAGAVIMNFTGNMNVSNLAQAGVALILCIFFMIYGSGKHSVDYKLKMHK